MQIQPLKNGHALEEADESLGWYDVLEGAGLADRNQIAPLRQEARELVAILAASRITALGRARSPE